MELFRTEKKNQPLAWRMQPGDLDELLGQPHLLSKNSPLRRLIEEDRMTSVIFYGPPGTGKTALAHIIARRTEAHFISINAVTAGIKDIREAAESSHGMRTILFIDEIHRFNKIQQDALLPHVENGDIILVGASTQNPFFALVPALSSRSQIFQFRKIQRDEITRLLYRAVSDKKGLAMDAALLDNAAADLISDISEGDARKALNILELSFLSLDSSSEAKKITAEHVRNITDRRSMYYSEDDHYDTISAFIKSMRGSDPDAAVYWMARMLEAGEDPLFIARRIVICAAEDVGLADPDALTVAVSALQSFEKTGMPEGRIPLAMAALYIATAPKSNSAYAAIDSASDEVRNRPIQEVPAHLKEASYRSAERLGAGAGYIYPHDHENHFVDQAYMPERRKLYTPSSEGFEKIIKERMHIRRESING